MRFAKAGKRMNLSAIGILVLLVLTPLFMSGCSSAGNFMIEAEPTSGPQQGKALVTLIRPSFVGGAIAFGMWDSDNLIGVLQAGKCIHYETVPGEHYFLARAENWSCVKADLAANRHYVIKANPFMGVWKARIALDPITKADYEERGQLKDVKKWLEKLKPVTPDPQGAEAYAQPRREQVLGAQANFKAGQGKCEILAPEDYMPE